MVKTPDELFDIWINGEILNGKTRKDFCEQRGTDIEDMRWAFCGGIIYSKWNGYPNEL